MELVESEEGKEELEVKVVDKVAVVIFVKVGRVKLERGGVGGLFVCREGK